MMDPQDSSDRSQPYLGPSWRSASRTGTISEYPPFPTSRTKTFLIASMTDAILLWLFHNKKNLISMLRPWFFTNVSNFFNVFCTYFLRYSKFCLEKLQFFAELCSKNRFIQFFFLNLAELEVFFGKN